MVGRLNSHYEEIGAGNATPEFFRDFGDSRDWAVAVVVVIKSEVGFFDSLIFMVGEHYTSLKESFSIVCLSRDQNSSYGGNIEIGSLSETKRTA